MRYIFILMLGIVVLALASTSAQARIAYADSDVFSTDTISSVGDPANSLPQVTGIVSIFPNPFNPATNIAFDLAKDGQVELAIFDVRGRLVSIVESGARTAGRHQATWYGTDRNGRGVPSGNYFCRLVAGKHTQTMKILLAK